MKTAVRLFKYLSVVRGTFIFGLVLLFLSTIGTQGATLMVQYMIDHLFAPVSTQQSIVWSAVFLMISAYIGVILVANIFGYFSTRLLMQCANIVAEYLRNLAYEKMQTLPVSYFDDKPAGKIASRIVNNTETLRSQFYGTLLTQLLYNGVMIVIVYVIIFSLDVTFGLVMTGLIPLFIMWQKFYQKKFEKPTNEYYEAQSDINTEVNETMTGSEILQLFHQEELTKERFRRISTKMLSAENNQILIDSLYSWSLVEVVKRLTTAGVLAIIGYQFIGGTLGISTGLIFSYINYIERLFVALGQFIRMFPRMQRSIATGKRVLALLDEVSETDTDMPLVVRDGVVIFDRVTFGYNPDQPILKNITFKANKGETVALVGHTGSGKSSIMNLLFRFYDAQSGQILIDGQNIAQYNRESVRQDMGIVLQDPYLFTGTIKSNVAMDNHAISDEDVLEALVKVGASEMLARLEQGINEPVIEKGNSFSSGERQLLSFARTLASDPKILILDEATSHIDTETEDIIQNAMNVVKEGRTTFMIAHRLSTIQSANQILVLHEGEIVERGTHQELIAQNGRYAEMYRMQQRI